MSTVMVRSQGVTCELYWKTSEKLKRNEEKLSKSRAEYEDYATQLCILDAEGRVERFVAAHDVGRAINPAFCEGQIEGSVHMGLGYALTEELVMEEVVVTGRFRASLIDQIGTRRDNTSIVDAILASSAGGR